MNSGKLANEYQLGTTEQQTEYLTRTSVSSSSHIANSPGAPSLLLQASAILSLTLTLKAEGGLGRDRAERGFSLLLKVPMNTPSQPVFVTGTQELKKLHQD